MIFVRLLCSAFVSPSHWINLSLFNLYHLGQLISPGVTREKQCNTGHVLLVESGIVCYDRSKMYLRFHSKGRKHRFDKRDCKQTALVWWQCLFANYAYVYS